MGKRFLPRRRDDGSLRLAASRRAVLGFGLALALLPRALRADSGFLAGQTLRVLISTGAGGPGELIGRLFVKYLEARLPDTRISVELLNRANGRLAALTLWEAEPNGLTIGFINSNLLYAQLLGEEALPFDLLRFDWLGSLTQDRRVLVVGERTGLADLAAVRAHEGPLLAASVATTSGHTIDALVLDAVLGLRLQPVPGYSGGQRALALVSGEADCMLGTFFSVYPVLQDGTARLILRLNAAPLPAPYDTVPVMADLLRPEHRWVVELIEAQCQLGRGIAAPPGLPADRLLALRALFDSIADDPAFAAEAGTLGVEIDPSPGDSIAATIGRLIGEGASLSNDLQALLACGRLRAESGTAC